MTETIVITSGKGGVGKTNISVNTALELARHDYNVCLLDADLGLANINILLGLYPDNNLDDVILREVPLEQIVVQTEYGVDLIPGSSGVEEMANLGSTKLAKLVEGFSTLKDYDYLLIDTSSGISRGVISFCLAATETLLVLTNEATSLTDAYGLLKVLSLNDYSGTVKILVNKCASVPQAKKTFAHFKSVVDKRLNIKIVPGGVILSDSIVEKAVSSQQPVHALYPESTFSVCIKALVTNLTRTATAVSNDENCGDFWSRYIENLQADLLLPGVAKKASVLAEEKPDQPVSAKHNVVGAPIESSTTPRKEVEADDHSGQQCIQSSSFSIITHLQSPPSLLASVIGLQNRGQLSLGIMREVIACDPALTMKALHNYHLSGSARNKGVVSLEKVLEELDEQMLSRLLLTTATHELLMGVSVAECAALNAWWAHSLRCGMMARALAELLIEPLPSGGYLAGLLHDIDRHSEGRELSESNGGASFTGRNVTDTGKDYNGVGADILLNLNICSLLVDAVRYHDETEAQIVTAFTLTKLVFIAHLLSTSNERELSRGVELAVKFFGVSASQVFTCIQVVSKESTEVAAQYGISTGDDIDLEIIAKDLSSYRYQITEYVTFQSALQLPLLATKSDMICAVHQGLSQIFGINRVVCLFPDTKETFIKAEGFSGCYCEENLNNIQFALHSDRSLVVAAYHSDKSTLLSCKSLQAIADRQVMAILDSDVLLCLPLICPPLGVQKGIVLCGVAKPEREKYTSLQVKLESFATQVAIKMGLITEKP